MELEASICWWSLTQGTCLSCLPSGNISENKSFMLGRCLHQGRDEQQRRVSSQQPDSADSDSGDGESSGRGVGYSKGISSCLKNILVRNICSPGKVGTSGTQSCWRALNKTVRRQEGPLRSTLKVWISED